MRSLLIALLAAAPLAVPAQAPARDNQAGTPLTPADAAGPWTLASGGRSVCVLGFSRARAGAGTFRLQVPAQCAGVLPSGVTGWAPASDGMDLVTADGRTIPFERWSNSLLVTPANGGFDLQLRRGAGEG